MDLFHNNHVHPAVFLSNEQDDVLYLDAHGDIGELYYYKVNLLVSDSGGLADSEYAFVYPRQNFLDRTGTMRPISHLDALFPPTSMGTGNPDIEVIRDGDIPPPGSQDPLLQFDTFHASGSPVDHWIGYELTELVGSDTRFVSMFFQEGQHGQSGGWFEDFWVEVRSGGEWHAVQDLLVDPPYPFQLSGQPGFDGSDFNRYELRFLPTPGDAIRLRGVPGGSDRFVSVAELRVGFLDGVPPAAFVDVTDAGQFIARVFELDPPYPTGSGNPDPETMRNGTLPPPGSQSSFAQYDTFHDGDQGQEDWIGLGFPETMEFARIVFQEGLHDAEGGRLADLDVQVQGAGGAWNSVAGLTATPPYPGSADLADTYETFELVFEPTRGQAIRIVGQPEGSVGWISIGELRVFVPYVDPGCAGIPDAANYCTSSPNSTGVSALISMGGCTSVSANDFSLRAEDATPNQFGRFFYGTAQTQVPFGDGFLCVTGGFYRLPVVALDSMGSLGFAVDFTDPPEHDAQILAGSTWNFQFWYRDQGGPGGTGFNFTNGLRVTFGP